MDKLNCKFFSNGECKKWQSSECRQRSIDDFCDEFHDVDMSGVCREFSVYGNGLLTVTEDDIEALRNGRVLCSSAGEYGIFIALKTED